jgi:glucose/arabinose dehydrogenase
LCCIASANGQWDDQGNGGGWFFNGTAWVPTFTVGVIEIRGATPNPDPTFTYNGKQYRLTSAAKTWEQAQAEAQTVGGNLVTINNAAEETWLKQAFGGTESFWIGITDRRIEGQFEWGNGETSAYRNWAPGEPNNANGVQDYGAMNYGANRQWDDDFSTTQRRGIIEIATTPPRGSIALEQNIYSVNEAGGGVDIAILRSGNSSGAATIRYRTDNGTGANGALNGSDFTAQSGTLSFAAGETRQLVRIPIRNDNQVEGNETFGFVIESPTGADLGTQRTATVTILDDDNPALTVNNIQVNENAGNAVLTLTRGSGVGTASVQYATVNGTAIATADYSSRTGTVSFAPGQTSQTLAIPLTNDSSGEANETFQVNFSNPTGVTLPNPSATVTIIDDDPGNFVNETVVSGLSSPTAIAWTPDNSLLFVLEKGGLIKVIQNGQVVSTFADLSEQVNNNGDRGALGLAINPNFYNGSPYIYVSYTYDPPEADRTGRTANSLDDADGGGNRPARVVRLTANTTNYRSAVANSEVILIGKNSTWANTSRPDGDSTVNFSIPESGRTAGGGYLQDYIKTDSNSHTIGSLTFGADGALYISVGDGTSYNSIDPRFTSALSPDSLSGKILRIDAITGNGLSDNPFWDGNATSNRSKVWNSGLRNPFRTTMKPGTSTLFIGDVGWKIWEEVNVSAREANFGWSAYEGGTHRFRVNVADPSGVSTLGGSATIVHSVTSRSG